MSPLLILIKQHLMPHATLATIASVGTSLSTSRCHNQPPSHRCVHWCKQSSQTTQPLAGNLAMQIAQTGTSWSLPRLAVCESTSCGILVAIRSDPPSMTRKPSLMRYLAHNIIDTGPKNTPTPLLHKPLKKISGGLRYGKIPQHSALTLPPWQRILIQIVII